MSWRICIPTHGRQEPKSLRLLNTDPSLELYYFIREEESDLYWRLRSKERVHVISLGTGLHELGETRERIMQWCRDKSIDYCIMLDDGVISLNRDYTVATTSITLDEFIATFEQHDMSDFVVGCSFVKKFALNDDDRLIKLDVPKPRDYLMNVPTQAVMLDVKKCAKYDLHYKSLDEVGFEDCAFFVDALKKGLIFASNANICFSAIIPNCKKIGGSHSANENLERKYDIQMQRCMKYIGNIYGVQMQKRWRNYAQSMLTMIEIDCDYFYEVLVKNRGANAQIIKDGFKIKKIRQSISK